MSRFRDYEMKGAAAAMAVLIALSAMGLAAMADDGDGIGAGTADESSAFSLGFFHDCKIEVAGLVHGFAEYLGYSHGEPDAAAGDDTAVKAAMRNVVMNYTAGDTSIMANTASSLINNNAQTLKFIPAYADRAVEVAAGSMWSSGAAYSAEAVLEEAGIYRMLGNSQYNTDYSLWYGFSNMADRASDQWSSSGTYSGIRQQITWDGGGTGATAESVMIYFTSIVEVSGTEKVRVWYGDDGAGSWHEPVWFFPSSSSASGTLTADDGGSAYTLRAGANAAEDLKIPAGWYTVSGNGIYAGNFQRSPDSDRAAPVSGGAVIQSGPSCGYVTAGDPAAKTAAVHWNGAEYTTTDLAYSYTDGSNSASMQKADGVSPLINLLYRYCAQTEEYNSIISSSAGAGAVMWTISSAAQKSNILLSPSSLTTRLSGLKMDTNQMYAVYVTALAQISGYYQSYGSQLTAAETRISAESMDLYCFGDVYDSNGDAVYSNVVFTPYTYNTTFNLYGDSKVTTWPMDGIAMVWTAPDAVYDIAQFSASDVSSYSVVVMPKGSTMMCKQVMYEGKMVSSVTLHATEISKTEALSSVVLDDTEAPKVLSAETLVMVIVLEAAAIIAVIGIWTRQPALIVIALVVAVCAVLFKGSIAGFLLGRFGS